MAKRDKLIYDTKKKEYFDPAERAKKEAKRKALIAKLSKKPSSAEVSQSILKGMADRVNRAESEEEAQKHEKRLERYKKLLSKD